MKICHLLLQVCEHSMLCHYISVGSISLAKGAGAIRCAMYCSVLAGAYVFSSYI